MCVLLYVSLSASLWFFFLCSFSQSFALDSRAERHCAVFHADFKAMQIELKHTT